MSVVKSLSDSGCLLLGPLGSTCIETGLENNMIVATAKHYRLVSLKELIRIVCTTLRQIKLAGPLVGLQKGSAPLCKKENVVLGKLNIHNFRPLFSLNSSKYAFRGCNGAENVYRGS